MTRLLFALLTAAVLLGATGCAGRGIPYRGGRLIATPATDPCGNDKLIPARPRMAVQQCPPMGGPAPQAYGYPYYTTRAPRDFLMTNYPSIGP